MDNFNYQNTEIKLQKGGKTIRRVSIKKGKGYKSITTFRKGRKVSTVRKPIHKEHIHLIKKGKFIPGLFLDCKCKTMKRRSRKGGDNDYDIEEGVPQTITPMKSVPPDPKRFDEFEKKMLQQSMSRSSSPFETTAFFEGPTPEEKQEIERQKMFNEDTSYNNPMNESMEEWGTSGGKRKKKRRV